jgi:hypothetical protein
MELLALSFINANLLVMRKKQEIKKVRPMMHRVIMIGLTKIDFCTKNNTQKAVNVAVREFRFGASPQKAVTEGIKFITDQDRLTRLAIQEALKNW